jgi:hypothetical protein
LFVFNAHNIFKLIYYEVILHFFRLSSEFYSKQFFSKWLSEINSSSELINDTTFGFYLAGLYLSKIGDHSQQQAILKLLNKKILLPLIAYAVDLETSHYNRFDLIKAIPTTACTQVNILLLLFFFACKFSILLLM